ncbi:MAG TPA: tetratricopeptide repeat protein [Bacteroidales bacterium]|nr:tetratricopeptide repeat protein [Bacteroidales bacterium]
MGRADLYVNDFFVKNKYADLLGLSLIMILGVIIYSNSFHCSFHLDDFSSIVHNDDRIKLIFETKYYWWFLKSTLRPLSIFSFAINYQISQFDVRSYHLVNLIIHLVNTYLVWRITVLLFSTPVMINNPISTHKKLLAFMVALFFVSHPLATQSVTYIVQRMNSMSAMFYFLSLVLYVKARLSDKSIKHKLFLFSGALIAAFLAFLSKENSLTLPAAIILSELFFLQKKKLSVILKDYRVLLSLIVFIVIIVFTLFKFSLKIFDPLPISASNAHNITSWNYLLTQFSVIVKYVQLLVLPINLNLDYDFPVSNNFFEWKTLLCFLLLLSLLTLALFLFKKHRIFSFGIFWFFLTLSVESSIIPLADVIFEHRTYLPSFGFFLILSTGIYIGLWNRSRYLAIAIVLIIAVSNSVLTYQRNKVWKDDVTLWSDVVSKSPDKARPYVNLGSAYGTIGDKNKAIYNFSKAIEISPDFLFAYWNRGLAYDELQQPDKALADYTKAIEIDRKCIDAYYNRGVVYDKLGQPDKAIEDYTKAIEIDPKTYVKSYNNRGVDYEKLGQWDKAIADYSKMAELEGWNARPLVNRGGVYIKTKQWNKALADLNRAIELDPKHVKAYNNRGIVYGNLGQWDKAIADFSKAIEIDPQFPDSYHNRDVAYRLMASKNNTE